MGYSSNLTNQNLAAILRAQAWERAKGELRSMFCTIYTDRKEEDVKKFDDLHTTVENFILAVEEDGLIE